MLSDSTFNRWLGSFFVRGMFWLTWTGVVFWISTSTLSSVVEDYGIGCFEYYFYTFGSRTRGKLGARGFSNFGYGSRDVSIISLLSIQERFMVTFFGCSFSFYTTDRSPLLSNSSSISSPLSSSCMTLSGRLFKIDGISHFSEVFLLSLSSWFFFKNLISKFHYYLSIHQEFPWTLRPNNGHPLDSENSF